MAKLPSPSSSSSSFALDFLRRLLCAHTTTAPRDDAAAAPGYVPAPEELEPEGRSPCIVARLMGLDAMPPPAETPAKQQPPLLRRSRSASSVSGTSPSGVGDAAADKPAAAGVVRTSASLREKPAYLRAENDMFLLLSFSPDPEEDRDDAKHERRRENGPDGEPVGGNRKQRRPHRRKLQFGGDDDTPQSSSPVSVLEAHEDSSTTTTTTTTSSSLEDVDTSEQQSSSSPGRRKPHCASLIVQVQLDDDDVSPATTSTAHATGCRSDRERRGNSRRRTGVANASAASDVSGVWQPVCRLVEEDLLRSAEWLPTRRRHGRACGLNVGGGGVVAEEVGAGILEQLVREATDELVRMCCQVACASPLPTSPMFEHGSAGSRKHSSGRARIAAGY